MTGSWSHLFPWWLLTAIYSLSGLDMNIAEPVACFQIAKMRSLVRVVSVQMGAIRRQILLKRHDLIPRKYVKA